MRCTINDAQDPERQSADDPLPALRSAAATAELRAEPATLVRYGSNAVFRLPDDVIARVSRPGASLSDARRQVDVARWLADMNLPAVEVVDIPQPVAAANRVVTFWRSASDDETYADIADVADLLRRLHQLQEPDRLELPVSQPFRSKLPPLDGLAEPDKSFLRERYDWARESFSQLPYALPRGVIHGDANVGNVIIGRDGRPLLIDLDSVSVGPREWDLVQTALFADRLGWHTAEEYARFVDVYGYDLREWEGYEQLADMREIAMTAWLSTQAATSERSAREAAKRIAAIRTGACRRDWSPY
ncbi:aminoglycoside phosphotransferase family protein [Pseudonocardia ailaonensis]|uniref:Aminoglycoside phosphotransferase family protein n=1 Tax=Pseudonocardia ailaonensis TaxID=367279 RepID=A0ABN2ND07_9PSEU